MLSKKNRLTFAGFYSNPNKSLGFRTGFLSVNLKVNGYPYPRIGVFVPKSLDKRAVYRHRTKRLIISFFRTNLSSLEKPVDIWIRASKILSPKTFADFSADTVRGFITHRLIAPVDK